MAYSEQAKAGFLKKKENHTGESRMKGWVQWGMSVLSVLQIQDNLV